MVEHTLQSMRQGGIYDHMGFGFHRYSTDERWLVPHFEKMLYDQALLSLIYTEAYQATGKDEYAKTAGEILTYVLRDMTAPEGGFYSAEDADSEGVEGKFYVWKEEEIRHILDKSEAELVLDAFSVLPAGNFHEEASGRLTGDNILHLRQPLPRMAERLGLDLTDLETRLDLARTKAVSCTRGASPSSPRRQNTDGLERPHGRRSRQSSPGFLGIHSIWRPRKRRRILS